MFTVSPSDQTILFSLRESQKESAIKSYPPKDGSMSGRVLSRGEHDKRVCNFHKSKFHSPVL